MIQETTVPDAVASGPAPEGSTLAIRWVFPAREGSITRLAAGTTLLGRDPHCAGCLPSVSVSRRHAEVRWTLGTMPMICDLASTNGLYLNGRSVKYAPLNLRDVVRLGDWIGVVTAFPKGVLPRWTFQELEKGYWAGPSLQAALAPARLVAKSDLPIIIQGPTGAGKEGAARAIHGWSGRTGPFLGVNCAALPESLAEGELFGYRKGAFTGADRAHLGHLRAAEGGTLFLDEIADLPAAIQAKLLRAIEQREVTPLGESMPVPIDVRLLAATQSSLRDAVAEKRFRADLLARLEGLTVIIPGLHERVEEIPSLFSALLEENRGSAPVPRLDPLLVERLCTHDWPFNVRELTLLVRKLLALHPDAEVLDHGIVPDLARSPAPSAASPSTADCPTPEEQSGAYARDPDAQALLAVLRANGGNVRRTAASFRISRARAYRILERIGNLNLAELRRNETNRD
jgi:transcriptional regulator with AAA-type ATPase domain